MCGAGQGHRIPTRTPGPPFGDSKIAHSGPSRLYQRHACKCAQARSPWAESAGGGGAFPRGRGRVALRGCGSRLPPAYECRYRGRPETHEAGRPRHGGVAARPAPGADSGGSHIRRRRGSRIPEVRAAADCLRWRRPRQVSAAGEGPGRRRAAAGSGGRWWRRCRRAQRPLRPPPAWPRPAIGRNGRVTPCGPAPLQRGGRDGGWEAVLAGRLSSSPSHLSANATQPFTRASLWSVCH